MKLGRSGDDNKLRKIKPNKGWWKTSWSQFIKHQSSSTFHQPFIQEISIKLLTTDFDFQFVVFPVNKYMFEVHKNKFVQFLFILIIEKAKEKQYKLFERNFTNLRHVFISVFVATSVLLV